MLLTLDPANTAGRTYLSIEDENRSSARVDLSRNLTDRLQIIARYTFYANEITASRSGMTMQYCPKAPSPR